METKVRVSQLDAVLLRLNLERCLMQLEQISSGCNLKLFGLESIFPQLELVFSWTAIEQETILFGLQPGLQQVFFGPSSDRSEPSFGPSEGSVELAAAQSASGPEAARV
jgi:hypothetical protein